MRVGDVLTWERTFTEEDVRAFARLSGDTGLQHIEPDQTGRLLVHGLLTATLPTKIGGDLNFLAQEMTYHFLRPVYTGDTVTCEVTLTTVDDRGDHIILSAAYVCRNQRNREVLSGHCNGKILKKQ